MTAIIDHKRLTEAARTPGVQMWHSGVSEGLSCAGFPAHEELKHNSDK